MFFVLTVARHPGRINEFEPVIPIFIVFGLKVHIITAIIVYSSCQGPHDSDNIFHLKTSITVAGIQMTTGALNGNFSDSPEVDGQTTYILPRTGGNGDPNCANNPGGSQAFL